MERQTPPNLEWDGGFRELERAMDGAADHARREFLQCVETEALRDALDKAETWNEIGLADLFAFELERRGEVPTETP